MKDEDPIKGFRVFPMLVILCCGLVLIGVGAYMQSHDLVASGRIRGRNGGGVNGISTMIFGFLMGVVLAVLLIRHALRK